MKFVSSLVKLSSVPPWATVVQHDNTPGWWTEVGGKHKVYLREKDNRVHLPRTFRGKALTDIRPEDFDALSKEDSGDAHYKLWRQDFDRQHDIDKIYNGYQFTPFGLVLLERLKKYLMKNKFDDVAQLGLDPKYSINMALFDKFLATPYLDKVKTIGRSIAKKYRMVITLLEEMGKKRLTSRMDRDFYYHWDKLKNLFDFDPLGYKPTAPQPEDEDEESEKTDDTLFKVKEAFMAEVHPFLNPQMASFIIMMENVAGCIDRNLLDIARQDFEHMTAILLKYIGQMGHHEIGQAAAQILQLPSYILLQNILIGNNNDGKNNTTQKPNRTNYL